MSRVVSTLTQAISYLNILLELDQTPPGSSDEDFVVWTGLFNTAVNLWENEDGVMWRELFIKLADAADGTKTTTTATSYAAPTLFRAPASAYVWLGTGSNKTAYKVIRQEEVQLYENNMGRWCYFLQDTTPTLEFNPNLSIDAGQTISYNFYKYASSLSSGTDTFEMADPMFAVFFALAILTKEEGNALSLSLSQQKLEAMKSKNIISPEFATDTINDPTEVGFGV